MNILGHLSLLPDGESQVKNLVLERFNKLPDFKKTEYGRLIFCDGFIYLNDGNGWNAIGKEIESKAVHKQKTIQLDITEYCALNRCVDLPDDLDLTSDFMIFFEGRRIFNNRDYSITRNTVSFFFLFL